MPYYRFHVAEGQTSAEHRTVARLIPARTTQVQLAKMVAAIREARRLVRRGHDSVWGMIDEGRR